MESRRMDRILESAKSAVKEAIKSDTFNGEGLKAIIRNHCKDIITPEGLMNDEILSGAVRIMMNQN